jgi:signal transduction histidine kinase
MNECYEIFEIQANRKGLEIAVNFDDKVNLSIRSDKNRLRQVLLNLLSNALKYT